LSAGTPNTNKIKLLGLASSQLQLSIDGTTVLFCIIISIIPKKAYYVKFGEIFKAFAVSKGAFFKKHNNKNILKVLRESRGHFFKSAHEKYYFKK